MDGSSPECVLSLLTTLSKSLQTRDSPAGQLKIGKQGVYLIDSSEAATSFRLVPWQQLLSGKSNREAE
jgi:hypothetical protein